MIDTIPPDEDILLFFKELKAHCADSGTNTFDFAVEMWGLNWMPWCVYAGKETRSLSFTTHVMDTKVLEKLVGDGKIRLVRVHLNEELDDLEIYRATYELL
jgi:hypothetical protein